MTLFDIVAGAVLLLSALAGLSRGFVRELVALCAFAFAAFVSVVLLPLSGPLARRTVHPGWAANAVAIVAVFLVAYITVRLFGGSLSALLRRHAALGALDRGAGFGFGVLRGLVLLGLFYIVFHAATPAELTPAWISGARLFPLSRASAGVIAKVAPQGWRLLANRRLAGLFGHAPDDGAETDDAVDAAAPAPAPPSKAGWSAPASQANGPSPYQPRQGTSARHHRRRTLQSDVSSE